eukprot:gb/GFBE01064903.1/.p1 GENE.gb/GFBE01064903.1/~~gb/GFBE01064903.1/.p1  ORF type:complete len:621 (+),score=121.00 gb/GFBE01064903.1/:1-1863(+)
MASANGLAVAMDAVMTCQKDQLQEAMENSGGDLELVLQRLLEVGGDERSVTNKKTGLTKYHTPTKPSSGIVRSSCTSNVPDPLAFSRGVDVLRQLRLEAKNNSKQRSGYNQSFSEPVDLFRKLLCNVRQRLRNVLSLDFADIINLFPSGTDAELMPVLLAHARASGCKGGKVLSIVSASGEVGSGTANAAKGEHFAKTLPSGNSPVSGPIFAEWLEDAVDARSDVSTCSSETKPEFETLELGLRNEDGRLLSVQERDALVERAVQAAVEARAEDGSPAYGQIVVHMVVGSKTGQSMPSEACLQGLVAKHGSDQILGVVDACQGRLREGAVREYLDNDWIVLTTGSKFMGGPPFAGVCLLSAKLAVELEQHLQRSSASGMMANSTLHEYVVASLMSDDMPTLRSLLPQYPLNYGVLMRWTLALHSMETYFGDVEPGRRMEVLHAWVARTRALITGMNSPHLKVLEDPQADHPADDEQAAALSSIVSFVCRCSRGATAAADAMTMDELRHLQFLMASDLSKLYPGSELPEITKHKFFMGQPVDLAPGSPTGERVLRVAFSAPLVVRAAKEGLDAIAAEDAQLFDKLSWLLHNWHVLETFNVVAAEGDKQGSPLTSVGLRSSM